MALILIIDDDDQFRSMLRQMLEREGYNVVDAPDGKEGIKFYRMKPTNLIITDILMPNKEGLETIVELRRDFPEVKIIAMSGGGLLSPETYLQMAKGFGPIPTLTKPFKRQELLDTVRKLLK